MPGETTQVGFTHDGAILHGYFITYCRDGCCVIGTAPRRKYVVPLEDIVEVG